MIGSVIFANYKRLIRGKKYGREWKLSRTSKSKKKSVNKRYVKMYNTIGKGTSYLVVFSQLQTHFCIFHFVMLGWDFANIMFALPVNFL